MLVLMKMENVMISAVEAVMEHLPQSARLARWSILGLGLKERRIMGVTLKCHSNLGNGFEVLLQERLNGCCTSFSVTINNY